MEIVAIAKNVFMHTSYQKTDDYGLVASNGLVVLEGQKAFLVDTPWSAKDTENLFNWISEQGYQLESSISTHSHEDRTKGIEFLNQKEVKTYTSVLTNQLLKEQGKPLAKHTFSGTEFSLSKDLVEVSFHGEGHTIDNLVVWLPKSDLIFGGCLVRSLRGKTLGYTGEASIDQWEGSIDSIISKFPNAKIVVPGHGKHGDSSLLNHTKLLVKQAVKKSESKRK